MKIVHNVYDELISLNSIFDAWRLFRSGKTRKKEVMAFEHNKEDNLFALHNELRELKYRHGKYERFVIKDPKRRIIHKEKIRDRVIHTLVARKLEEKYQPVFIVQSYACQKERGIHRALSDMIRYSRRVSRNYTRNFWYLKCDIRKFFDNIDHEILSGVLKRKIKDEKLLWLIEGIIGSFYQGREGKGLPLGNFTSQWLANIYLNELDCFIKQELKVRYYLRYADDFLLLSQSKAELENHLENIRVFLVDKLKLALHPNKVFIKKFSRGIDFVGYRVLPHHILLNKVGQRRMQRKLRERILLFQQDEISQWQYYETLNSYLGWLKHSDSFGFTNSVILNNLTTRI